jgi:hypothetical protein
MRITVTIPDELAAQVQARGFALETYVTSLIENAARHAADTPSRSRRPRDMTAFFQAMAAHSEKIPQLPDEAFSREIFYQDHD